MQDQTSQNLENFQELMKKILQAAEYDLNPFIYDGVFDAGKLEIDDAILSSFFEILPQVILEQGKEYFLKLIEENSKYENCTEFFSWLYGYAKTVSAIYQIAEGIRELSDEDFEQLFAYCLEKLILHNIGFEAAVDEMQGQELYHADYIKSMASLINMYYTWIFIKGDSKDDIERRMTKMAGISEDKCLIFWENYLQNEDALWKKYSLKLQNQINDKLELFIKTISSMDEE